MVVLALLFTGCTSTPSAEAAIPALVPDLGQPPTPPTPASPPPTTTAVTPGTWNIVWDRSATQWSPALFHGTLVIESDGSVGLEWWESAREATARDLEPALVVSTPTRVHVEWTCCESEPGAHFVVLEAAIRGEEIDGQLRWQTGDGRFVGWSPVHGDRVRMFVAERTAPSGQPTP